jgi:hypothetical protein
LSTQKGKYSILVEHILSSLHLYSVEAKSQAEKIGFLREQKLKMLGGAIAQQQKTSALPRSKSDRVFNWLLS